MKKLFAVAALCAMSLATMADAYRYLTVTNTDGTSQSLDVSNGLTITFAGGNMIATDGTNTTTLPLSSLATMAFTDEAAAIERLAAGLAANATVQLFSMDGKLVGTYDAAALRQASLGKGVYMVRSGSTTKKIVVK